MTDSNITYLDMTYSDLKHLAWASAEVYCECLDFTLHTNDEYYGEHYVDDCGWPVMANDEHGVISLLDGSDGGLLIQITHPTNGECEEQEVPAERLVQNATSNVLSAIREIFESMDV